MGKGINVHWALYVFTVIAMWLNFISIIMVIRAYDKRPPDKVSQNSTELIKLNYKYSKSVDVSFNNRSKVGLSDTNELSTYYLNTTNHFTIDSYYNYTIHINFLRNSYFKVEVDNPDIKISVSAPCDIEDGWFKTLDSKTYSIMFKSKSSDLKTNGILHTNKTLYNTTNLDMCTSKCITDKPYLILISGSSENVSTRDIFRMRFIMDEAKVFNTTIIKCLYAYFTLLAITLIRIIYIFCT